MARTDIEPLKEYLSTAVAYIIETREGMNRPPFMALKGNIRNVVAKDLDAALAEMCAEGLLTERKTINDVAYEFTPPKKTNLTQK